MQTQAPTDLTVVGLKAAGYRVRIMHYRCTKDFHLAIVRRREGNVNGWPSTEVQIKKYVPVRVLREFDMMANVSARGGATIAVIDKPGEKERVATAECADTDAFCYAEGVRIAIAKAFGVYNHAEDKERRKYQRASAECQKSFRQVRAVTLTPDDLEKRRQRPAAKTARQQSKESVP